MTRIVAGTAGGRTLRVPRDGTRPTSDRVREAVFSRLDHLRAVDGARVLDLFAGSGALGIEAASRGAAAVTLVDSARAAVQVCQANATSLGLSQVVAVLDRAERFVRRPPPTPWDLVFLDPPYELPEEDLAVVLDALVGACALVGGAVVVVERSARSPEPRWPAGLERADSRAYGDTVVWFADAATHGAGSPEPVAP